MTVSLVGASFVESGSPLVAQLRAQLGDVFTYGVRGAKIGPAVDAWMSAHPSGSMTDALVFEMGGNGPPTSEQVREAHRRLATRARSVRWVLPPEWPVQGRTKANRDAARVAILGAGVPVVRHAFAPRSSELARDGQHLTPDGYRRFASAVVEALPKGSGIAPAIVLVSILAAGVAAAVLA